MLFGVCNQNVSSAPLFGEGTVNPINPAQYVFAFAFKIIQVQIIKTGRGRTDGVMRSYPLNEIITWHVIKLESKWVHTHDAQNTKSSN